MLTLSGIAAKTVDFVFRAYYSRMLGGEGLGIFSLCFGVHGIMLNVATGGIGVAVSKIVSGQLAGGKMGEARGTIRIAIAAVCALSAVVMLLAGVFSQQIAEFFLKEPRARGSIVCLAPSVLFMGISYCIKGYFYASRRVFPPASSEFLEQLVKITSITYLLSKLLPSGVERGCEAVFLGISIGEFSSCLYLLIFYLTDKKYARCEGSVVSGKAAANIFRISLPVMATSLVGSFLRMREDVLIVAALNRSGFEHSQALEMYGNIRGMIMPLVVFPLTLMSSCFTMLVPEISRACSLQGSLRLKTLISRIYRFCAFLGFLVMSVLVVFAKELATVVYNAPEIAEYTRVIALFVPFMFMDSVSCGILNGMGKQTSLFLFSITDSLGRIALISVLIPVFGIEALLLVIVASNVYTFLLSLRKVLKTSGMYFEWSDWFLKHLAVAVIACFVADSLFVGLTRDVRMAVVLGAALTGLVYICGSTAFSSASRSDLVWLLRRAFGQQVT